MYWVCTALTVSGQEIVSSIYGEKKDVIEQLSKQKLILVEMKIDYKRSILRIIPKRRLSSQVMAVFFEDFSNLLESGMSISQVLLVLQESTKEEVLNSALIELEKKLKDGESLTESLKDIGIFPWIVVPALTSGERTGKLLESTVMLTKYFKNSYSINSKLKQALIYPLIVLTLLLGVMLFINYHVLPQLKALLPEAANSNQIMQCVYFVSSFLRQNCLLILLFLGLSVLIVFLLKNKYPNEFQNAIYLCPFIGNILKEFSFALYFLNLSVLLQSGVSLLQSIEEMDILEDNPVTKHFLLIKEYIYGGASFWSAVAQDKFFPLIISSTLRRGEEMVKMDEYCLSLSEYFNRRVNTKMNTLLNLIQPIMLGIGGVFLMMIALGFLFPIYGNLSSIVENP